jgi:hypothetical protein
VGDIEFWIFFVIKYSIILHTKKCKETLVGQPVHTWVTGTCWPVNLK